MADFIDVLLRRSSSSTEMIPDTSNPISSIIPRVIAAEKPMIDQIDGMINKAAGHFLSVRSNTPKVKIAVGHGSPKVGDDGYMCP